MPETHWKAAETAATVCSRFDDRVDMPPPGRLAVRDYFDSLTESGQFAEAVVFLAYLLPPREAVWWGCLCVWRLTRPQPATLPADEAFAAVMRWILDPQEEHCRAATVAAEAAGDGPVGFLARAVGFCSVSMLPPELPPVPPPALLASAHRRGDTAPCRCRWRR